MRVVTVVGARPQFVKLAPVSRAMKLSGQKHGREIEDIIVHTGQHYDSSMSDIFFEQLEIPKPVVDLGVGSGSHGAQTARMLENVERELLKYEPDMVVVYGDTNSTVAGALAAAKLQIPIAHIEAGLRSFDRGMPEEVNRIIADHISELLFAPAKTAMTNLKNENLSGRSILAGDVMYDAVAFNRNLADEKSTILEELGIEDSPFAVTTLHRAANTDTEALNNLLGALNAVAETVLPVIFPIHPRTVSRIKTSCPEWKAGARLKLIDPVGYLEMLQLTAAAKLVLTDSGGLQKEAFFLGTPCVTLRNDTEWPETIEAGWNRLVGCEREKILLAANESIRTEIGVVQELGNNTKDLFGDGHAAELIVDEIVSYSK